MRKLNIIDCLSRSCMIFAGLFCIGIFSSSAQISHSFSIDFKWNGIEKYSIYDDTISRISFDGVYYEGLFGEEIPYYQKIIPVYSSDIKVEFDVHVIEYEPVPEDEIVLLPDDIDRNPRYYSNLITSRDDVSLCFNLLPFFKNEEGFMRVLSCEVNYTLVDMNVQRRTYNYADNSVLATGKWYKMTLQSTGIYKITYSELSSMGVPVSSINPKNIRIYHNGGGILSALNNEERYDDLIEIPLFVYGEEDGNFGQNDYILFYGRGPVVWEYDNNAAVYKHVKNPYSDYSYAFLTVDLGEGKRIQTAVSPAGAVDENIDMFLDYQRKEEDLYNLNNMGATWYFDKFDMITSRDYSFNFPNLITDKECNMYGDVASRNFSSASFVFKANGIVKSQLSFSKINPQYTYAFTKNTGNVKFNSNNDNITINLSYSKSGSSSMGWLDYIAVNAWRKLSFTGNAMSFRNPECNDSSKVYQYSLSNASRQVRIWDVTNPVEPKRIETHLSSSTASFVVNGANNNEFIAFNGNAFNSVTSFEIVENQNLHSKYDIDYLIITYPDFKDQAQRLKEIHRRIDDLSLEIVMPQQIYNEFSCGAQDITAIRDYIKMLYEKSGHRLQYVLLYGDASYDFKNKSGKVCFIPTYESEASCDVRACIATDDFYVCLGDNEGNMEDNSSAIDLAIGRMPVSTREDASAMIDKIEAYLSQDDESMNTWRKIVTFVADDDGNEFIKDSEQLEDTIKSYSEGVNIDKIYLDAYPQIATSSGQRSPECNEAITNRVEHGSLIVNYIGHAGEVGWAEERILTNEDINAWHNSPKLHLMVTASCEFSRYDDHTRTSSGEYVFLNHYGGAITMITTARVTGGSENFLLLLRLYRSIFNIQGGEYPLMGDVFVSAKYSGKRNTKAYVFFGDPALRLNYPKNIIELTSINNHDINRIDTLKALQNVTVKGVVKDVNNEVMTDFNGLAYITVYDKENSYTTYGNQGSPYNFKLRNSLIYNGKTVVENGCFEAEFVLPKDINYSYGYGLMSFYASNYETDAQGSFSDFIVGGFDQSAEPDEDAPEINIYIDDTLFVDGSITNENPVFIAYIKDKNGINTSGSGIGHDITAKLSGATNKTYNLNQYYEAPISADKFGTIVYKFYNLNEGEHVLTFRVWDIYNNSNTATLRFNVMKSNNLALENVMNYPNPFTNNTNFVFEHNQKDNFMDVQIRIYNIMGQLVRTIYEQSEGSSTRINPIRWDGTSDNGVNLPAGVYVYYVTISNSNNEKASGYSKLVISNN